MIVISYFIGAMLGYTIKDSKIPVDMPSILMSLSFGLYFVILIVPFILGKEIV